MSETNQIFKFYRLDGAADRAQTEKEINKMITEGWYVESITGVGGRSEGVTEKYIVTSPSIAVLYGKTVEKTGNSENIA